MPISSLIRSVLKTSLKAWSILVTMKAFYFDGDNGENIREEAIPADILDECKKYREELIAAVGEFDEVVGNKYFEGQEVTVDELRNAIRKATLSLNFTPVMTGSAYKNKGVQLLLDAVTYYLPSPAEKENIALDQNNNEAKVVLEVRSKTSFCRPCI